MSSTALIESRLHGSNADIAPVSVVILTWNGLEYTKPCLTSVLKNTDLKKVDVIVVDNGSIDGTVEYLAALPQIIPIFNDQNLGFVKGNNEALKRIDSSHDVILLNNDTEIDDPLWIQKLQATAYASDDVGVVGCRIRRLGGGMLQHAGTYIPDRTYWGQQLGGGEKDINQYAYDREVEGVVFACVLIRRTLLEKIGYLDEDFFSYYEDSDYCLKARAAGYRVMNCGALTVRHREHGSTSANNASHSEMFLKSKETFLGKWKGVLDSRYQLKLHLRSTFFHPIGYAMTARQIASSLDSQGVSVSYEYLYGPGTVFPVAESREQNTGVYQLEIIKQRPAHDTDGPILIYGQADAFSSVKGGYRIGYTMLETTGVPANWIDGCNGLDELWVPSEFNKWTFARSGAHVPIHVMPLGLVDTNYFNPLIEGMKIPGLFTFLSIFEWGERKSPELLLRAFNRAFKADEPVVLICKYSNRDPGVDPEAIIRSLDLDPAGGRVVYSENESVPYYQIAQIYRSADCFVLATRGEGWGMPIMEAMACGLPVIASYWSAQQAFLDDDNSYPLQVSLTDAEAKCPYYLGFKWALPDEDHLIKLLRHVFENQDEARAKGVRAAEDVESKWSITHSAGRMKARLQEVAAASNPEPRIKRRRVSLPRIGLDVSRAIGSEVSGVGRYTTSLVNGISKWQQENGKRFDYLLFPGFADFVHPNFVAGEEREFAIRPNSGVSVYRGPLPAFNDADHVVPGLDVVYCTGNAFPASIRTKSVMVVYDTTFISHPQFHTEENIRLCTTNFERAVASDAKFIAISESSRKDFIKYYGIDEARITTIYCGVDLDLFQDSPLVRKHSVRQRHALPEKYFLYVGSIEPRKNLRSLLKAMTMYRGPETLVVVGASGWHNEDIRKLMSRAGSKVKVLGYVPFADLPALYSLATAFVYPSLYEGFGLPVVEAMGVGTPVITSRNSSLQEIGDQACVLLDDPESDVEIVDALERIATNEPLANALSVAGKKRAANFSLDVQVARHNEFFMKIIED